MKALITHVTEFQKEYKRITYNVVFYKDGLFLESRDVNVYTDKVIGAQSLLEALYTAVVEEGKAIGLEIASEEIIKA